MTCTIRDFLKSFQKFSLAFSLAKIKKARFYRTYLFTGAGDGNRTRVISLEG